jgi:hypothetical protein
MPLAMTSPHRAPSQQRRRDALDPARHCCERAPNGGNAARRTQQCGRCPNARSADHVRDGRKSIPETLLATADQVIE